jgi:hypothetical protein
MTSVAQSEIGKTERNFLCQRISFILIGLTKFNSIELCAKQGASIQSGEYITGFESTINSVVHV